MTCLLCMKSMMFRVLVIFKVLVSLVIFSSSLTGIILSLSLSLSRVLFPDLVSRVWRLNPFRLKFQLWISLELKQRETSMKFTWICIFLLVIFIMILKMLKLPTWKASKQLLLTMSCYFSSWSNNFQSWIPERKYRLGLLPGFTQIPGSVLNT